MAIKRAVQIQGEICQIFVKNNMQWSGRAPSDQEVAAFEAERKSSGIGCVFGHTGYLINLGAPPSEVRDKSIASLIQELEFAAKLKLPFLVLHPGAHIGAGEEEGLRRVIAGLDEVFAATRKLKVRLALENTAGQGSCLGYKFEHLAAIYDGVKSPRRLAVCLDTAHLFASGFDIRTQKGWEEATSLCDGLVGLDQVVALHLNDSKTDLGSRVDRHEHIGQGHIGKSGFRHIVKDRRFKDLPGCLETPGKRSQRRRDEPQDASKNSKQLVPSADSPRSLGE